MTQGQQPFVAFNRGVVSRLGLARHDVPRLRLAAAVQTNFMPRVLGSMMLRPGTAYCATTRNGAFARTIPYVRSATAMARLELTAGFLRVLIDDALVTRPTVTAAVMNGTFAADISGWTDADEGGAASTWHASGYAQLLGDGTNFAILQQEVPVNQIGTEHALRIVVIRGPVMFRVGLTAGSEEYIGETALGTGTHSIALTPSGGNFFIQLSSRRSYPVLVDSVAVEGAGVLELPTPWFADDLATIRHTTSGDVIYVADRAHDQRKIERRGARSWSVVAYEPETGPFRVQNVTNTTIAPSALEGSVTLTASKGVFRSGHVGALFRVASVGQAVAESISAQDTWSDPIRVSGVGEARRFGYSVAGIFTAVVTIQYSVGEPGTWVALTTQYSAPASGTYLDTFDNQVIYYRIGVDTGDYVSDTASVALTYAAGSISGVARITAVASTTSASAIVLKAFGNTTASPDWWEGEWSGYRGYPSALTLNEGRLWFAGRDKLWASISDAYEDFDDEFEGDAGPISRSIGEGPVEAIHWLLALGRLLFGTALNSADLAAAKIGGNNVYSVRSSSFDEPLTPTNFSIKNASVRGVFVDTSKQRLYELAYGIESNDYLPEDLSVLVPDLNIAGIVGIAVQMKPDVRIHCWRADGTVGALVFDRAENVICWVNVDLPAAAVEDVSVLPGTTEDLVYYVVRRNVNGQVVRYHERWAMESQCTGRTEARCSDSHVVYSGAPSTVIADLGHLEGEEVVVWGFNTVTPFTDDYGSVGRDFGTFTVSGGQITGLAAAVTDACVGLAYTAEFQSAKLALAEAVGAPFNQMKRVVSLGLVFADTHYQGLRYGTTLDNAKMFNLSRTEGVKVTPPYTVWEEKDTREFPVGGGWSTDSRLCLRAASPRPCTVLAATIGLEQNQKSG